MTIKGFQTEIGIEELSNTSITGSPALDTGHALIYNSVTGIWENKATPIFAGLDALPDVTITKEGSPLDVSEKQILSYDTAANLWINRKIPDAGLLACSTGLMTGGELQFGPPNGSPLLGSPQVSTTVTITAGEGVIVNNYTDPTDPTYTNVAWTEFTDVTVTSLGGADRTFFAINNVGTLLQQTTEFTAEEHRDVIHIGTAGHANHTNIVAVRSNPHAAFDPNVRLGDLAEAIGAFNVTGNVYENTGGGVTVDKTVGESYRLGNNFHTSKKSPDITEDAIDTTLSFNYSYRNVVDGTSFTLTTKTTLIDAGNYDFLGDGTLTALPANDWQVQVIKHFPGGAGHRIEYGQTKYGTPEQAIADIPDVNHIHNPAFAEGIIRSYLVVRGGATDLSLIADAQFIEAGRFGVSGAAGSTGGGVFTSSFESSELIISASGDHTEPHGLGVVPQGTQAFLRCKIAELGYIAGDEAEFMNWDGVASYKGLHSDGTDIHWHAGPDLLIARHVGSPIGGSAVIDINNWVIVLRAYA